jgi:hypothetical protein
MNPFIKDNCSPILQQLWHNGVFGIMLVSANLGILGVSRSALAYIQYTEVEAVKVGLEALMINKEFDNFKKSCESVKNKEIQSFDMILTIVAKSSSTNLLTVRTSAVFSEEGEFAMYVLQIQEMQNGIPKSPVNSVIPKNEFDLIRTIEFIRDNYKVISAVSLGIIAFFGYILDWFMNRRNP